MPSTPWMISSNPLSPGLVKPGRLVIDRQHPENGFFAIDSSSAGKFMRAEVDSLAIDSPSRIVRISKDATLSLTLSTFASQFLGGGRGQTKSLEACHGTRYLLVQPDTWFEEICGEKDTRSWLERRIRREGQRVWLITGVLTLADTEVKILSGRRFAVGAGGSVPLLLAMGVPPLPSPLDPGANIKISNQGGEEISFKIPDEKVFEIQYREVKLHKRILTWSEAEEDYSLYTKTRWEPMWDLRTGAGSGNEDEEEEEDYAREVLEAMVDNSCSDKVLRLEGEEDYPLISRIE